MPRPLAAIAAAAVAAAALGLAACGGRPPAPHWPKSAGAITPDDPADDGGESLEPRQVSEGAAAVEHGGEDITSILDQPPAPAPAPTPATSSSPPSSPADAPPEAAPVFDEIIIVN